MKVTILSLAAAISPILTPDIGERAARLLHERGVLHEDPEHCHFRFCHCPAEICCLGREREPGEER